MINQLDLLRSMYEFQNELGSDIFAQRYIEICNIMAEKIDPSSFIIRGDHTPLIHRGDGVMDFGEKNRESILNQFEIIDAKNYQEEIKDGVIYLYRGIGGAYILFTCTKIKNKRGNYFVMYGGMTNNRNITWSSSGFHGWEGYPTLKENIVKWMGTGEISILKGYNFADPQTITLNYSRRGF